VLFAGRVTGTPLSAMARRDTTAADAAQGKLSVWLIPSMPAAAYRTLDSLAAEIARKGAPAGAQASATTEQGSATLETSVCIQ